MDPDVAFFGVRDEALSNFITDRISYTPALHLPMAQLPLAAFGKRALKRQIERSRELQGCAKMGVIFRRLSDAAFMLREFA